MNTLQHIKITPIDDNAVVQGVWTKYRGVDLKIARAGNERFSKTFMRLSRPYRKDITNDSIDTKVAESIMSEALADGIVVDWKNFVIGDNEIEYSKATAQALMLNDGDCRKFVQEFSNDLNNFIILDKEEIVAKS